MELPSQEVDIPIPINSTYGGDQHGHGHGHMILHDHAVPHINHIVPSAVVVAPPAPQNPSNGPHIEASDHGHLVPYKKMIRYRECLKNHAASMGGNATDGCGEFMPSGEEGSLEALTCSACNCHRNFHRKEIEGHDHNQLQQQPSSWVGRKVNYVPHHHKSSPLGHDQSILGYPSTGPGPGPHHQMIMSYNMRSESSDHEQEDNNGVMVRPVHHHHHNHMLLKKRFRTKFSQEQKEKMLNFAEKVGWKIQKQEESVVQQFCQQVGVKRRVLKVWMHNNKHNLAKLQNSNNLPQSSDHHQV